MKARQPTQNERNRRVLSAGGARVALVAGVLLLAGRASADYCATQPPPKGLVERCRSKEIVVPRELPAFREQLREWMGTCVIAERRFELVDGNASVDEVWTWIASHRGAKFTIVPEYTAVTYTRDGRTCYGVGSVVFRLKRPVGTVDDDGPIEVTYGPTSDQIKAAALTGEKALKDPSIPGGEELSRMLSVLDRMKRLGKDFDDTYYAVGPYKDVLGDWDPPACYKAGRYGSGGYEYYCRPADDALKTCERHLADRLVEAHLRGLDPRSLAELLLIWSNEIDRGLTHLIQLQTAEGKVVSCEGVRKGIMPAVRALRDQENSIYSVY
jgi:hypothetical protein